MVVSKSVERLDWNEIVERYPDRWVGVRDYILNGAIPNNAEVVCICTDKEVDKNMVKYGKLGIKLYWLRTTELEEVDILC